MRLRASRRGPRTKRTRTRFSQWEGSSRFDNACICLNRQERKAGPSCDLDSEYENLKSRVFYSDRRPNSSTEVFTSRWRSLSPWRFAASFRSQEPKTRSLLPAFRTVRPPPNQPTERTSQKERRGHSQVRVWQVSWFRCLRNPR